MINSHFFSFNFINNARRMLSTEKLSYNHVYCYNWKHFKIIYLRVYLSWNGHVSDSVGEVYPGHVSDSVGEVYPGHVSDSVGEVYPENHKR